MNFDDFVKSVVKQDDRNKFLKSANIPKTVPKNCIEFYRKYDPVDVEVTLSDLTSVKFCTLSSIDEVNSIYELGKDCFIFATREGDPIFIKGGHVYTWTHGSTNMNFDKIAESFEKYIELLYNELENSEICKNSLD